MALITTRTGKPLEIAAIPGIRPAGQITTVEEAQGAFIVLSAYRRYNDAVSTPWDVTQERAEADEMAVIEALVHTGGVDYPGLLAHFNEAIQAITALMGAPARIDVAEQIRRSVR